MSVFIDLTGVHMQGCLVRVSLFHLLIQTISTCFNVSIRYFRIVVEWKALVVYQ